MGQGRMGMGGCEWGPAYVIYYLNAPFDDKLVFYDEHSSSFIYI